mgnify:CR=1 FL=1
MTEQYPRKVLNLETTFRLVDGAVDPTVTLLPSDSSIEIDATAVSTTVTLPSAASVSGRKLYFNMEVTSGTTTSTISCAGTDTFPGGGASLVISDSSIGGLILQSNGSNQWQIVSSNVVFPGVLSSEVDFRGTIAITADNTPPLAAVTKEITVVNASPAGAFDLRLPANAQVGSKVCIVNVNATAVNVLTVLPAVGETISGAAAIGIDIAGTGGTVTPLSATFLKVDTLEWCIWGANV